MDPSGESSCSQAVPSSKSSCVNDDDDDTQDSQATTSSMASSTTASSVSDRSPSLHTNWDGSIVEYYGPSTSHCGYCKKTVDIGPHSGGRRSYDMQAYKLTARDYLDFLDRGWRRSGEFCYLPINQTTCCPNYSIVCKAIDFKLSRSQRRCIERFNSYLITGSVKECASISYDDCCDDLFSRRYDATKSAKAFSILKQSSKARDRRYVKTCERISLNQNISIEDAMSQVKEKWLKRCPKALSLEDYLYPRGQATKTIEAKHKLEINMYHVNSRQSQELRNEEHSIIEIYQKQVHNETRREWTMSRYCDFLVKTPILVTPMEGYDYLDVPSNELEQETLSKDIHASSKPFILHKPPQLPTCFGTYHCSYHLDDKLIAVGVLDVLPKCVTTVYFFYDPEYAFLNLGVYSALVEISMVRQIWSRYKMLDSERENAIRDYYLGYYVHECKKMHYKTRYKPSYLLCCKSLKYVPTEVCLQKLKDCKYADFFETDNPAEINRTSGESIDLKKLLEVTIEWPVEINQPGAPITKLLNYLIWLENELSTEYVELFFNGYMTTFAHLVGDELLSRLCLKTDMVHRTLVRRRERLAQRGKTQRPSSRVLSNQR